MYHTLYLSNYYVKISTKAAGNRPSLPSTRPFIQSASIFSITSTSSPTVRGRSPSASPGKVYSTTARVGTLFGGEAVGGGEEGRGGGFPSSEWLTEIDDDSEMER